MAIKQQNTRRLRRLCRNLVPVTLRRRSSVTSTTVYDEYAVPQAQQFPLQSDHQGPSQGLPTTRCRWLLWADVLEPLLIPPPRPGDLLREADNTEWMIDQVEKKMLGNDYSCECTKKPRPTS